jgi:hypothetical protein
VLKYILLDPKLFEEPPRCTRRPSADEEEFGLAGRPTPTEPSEYIEQISAHLTAVALDMSERQAQVQRVIDSLLLGKSLK